MDQDNPKLLKPASRRAFVAGMVGAVGAAALPTSAAVPSQTASNARETDYDVIVVGGGFSGVTAARDCAKNGLKTLLVEGRSRLGGRTFDTEWNNHHIELGGTWVHWIQPYTWSEVQRYGLEITETPGADPDRFIGRSDNFFTDVAYSKVAGEIARAGNAYFADARSAWARPWDTHYSWDKLTALDHVTTADRLSSLKLSPLARTALEATLEACTGARIDQGSYLEIARWYALGGWGWDLFSDSIQRYQIVKGTGELVRRIAKDGNAEVRLSCPIRRIAQHHDVAVVTTTAGESVSARALILALPMNCLVNIEFEPALSSGKLNASRERHSGAAIKFYIELKGRHGNAVMLAPYKYGAGYVFTYKQTSSSTVFVGFGADPNGFDPNDEQSSQSVMRHFIPDAEVIGCTSYSWVNDPFSLGTHCSYPPGKLTKWFDELRRREGQIYMAGSDVSEGYRGFIDGAIARGAREANQVSVDLLS